MWSVYFASDLWMCCWILTINHELTINHQAVSSRDVERWRALDDAVARSSNRRTAIAG
jgi:hypothetical protein